MDSGELSKIVWNQQIFYYKSIVTASHYPLTIISILIFYLSLYHLDTVSDWLNGFGMLRVGIPKVDNLLEELLVQSFFDSSNLEVDLSDLIVEDLNKTDVGFSWVVSHEQDQVWGIMTIFTTFVPGIVYGLGNILCYVTKTETYLYEDLHDCSALNVLFKSLFLMFLFPVYVTSLMVRTCFHQDEANFLRLLAVILQEAFLESAPQVRHFSQ